MYFGCMVIVVKVGVKKYLKGFLMAQINAVD
jgi:hypothetical protein